jgi:flagellar motor protein MotB
MVEVEVAMTNSASSIALERKGHRRGLVLGLTMAETFLLLVFCLLLVAAGAISRERQRGNQAVIDRDSFVAKLEAAQQSVGGLASSNQSLSTEVKDLKQFSNQAVVERNFLRTKLETAQQTAGDLAAKNQLLSEELGRAIADARKVDENWHELRLASDTLNKLSEQGLSNPEVLELAPAMKLLKEQGFLKHDPAQIAEHLRELFRAAEVTQSAKLHDWPPIINLSEAGGYYFAVGSAELSPEFERKLKVNIAGVIEGYLKDYNVDVIEVIGHTDEQPLSGLQSNLDRSIGALLAEMPVTGLRLSDNAGLGLARAIAVAKVLRADPRLAGASVLPLSGAQLIMPGDILTDGKHAGDVETRRRIEIRVRRRSRLSAGDGPSVAH